MSERTGEQTATFHTAGEYTLVMQRTASWCPNCGRRRGGDGRCADCDPWWTSPIVQIGGPISLGVVLLLLGGITLMQPNRAPGEVRSAAAISRQQGVTPTFGSYASPVHPYGNYSPAPVYTAPVYNPAPIPAVNFARAVPPSLEELQLRAIEQLREVTAYTDAVVEQQRQARWQQQRAALQSYQSAAYMPVSYATRPVAEAYAY
jgi:hypothetical protein